MGSVLAQTKPNQTVKLWFNGLSVPKKCNGFGLVRVINKRFGLVLLYSSLLVDRFGLKVYGFMGNMKSQVVIYLAMLMAFAIFEYELECKL